jgi:chorismate dehydratase
MDLAREWNEMTGLPFVFAFWACRPVVPWRPMQLLLEESLEAGLADLQLIVQEESARTGLPEPLVHRYLSENIRYRLGAQESESLRLFYRMCRGEGILDHAQGWLRMDQARGAPASGMPATSSETTKSG